MDGRGERQRFGIAENLNGFARGIDDDAAIAAGGQVLLEGLDKPGLKFAVEVIRELSNDFLAVHADFACLK